MYDKKIKKVVYLVNIGNYEEELRKITYPLIHHYANKIGAEICYITEPKINYPSPRCEKLQIYELAQKNNADWNIYIDSDTLVHPDCFDFTAHMSKDTVAHNGKDMATHRWYYDRYFRRDGRHIGSCNWFAIASDWCIDLWRPLDDLTPEEALTRIFPTVGELNGCIGRKEILDDYILSRNIARYGLKYTTFIDICEKLNYKGGNPFLFHAYNVDSAEKLRLARQVLNTWGILSAAEEVPKCEAS